MFREMDIFVYLVLTIILLLYLNQVNNLGMIKKTHLCACVPVPSPS